MLKIFDKLDDVPEALREHYKLIEGKYVPEVSIDHPLVLNNATLLNEKNTAETKAAGLETEVAQGKAALTAAEADVATAKAGGMPRGHVAVPKADAELLTEVKAFGDDVVAKLTEYVTLKEDSERRTREDHLRKVAKILGYDNEEAFVRLPGLPELEIRDVAGKKTVFAKVKDDQGADVEKPAKEFIESSTEIAPFLTALKTEPPKPWMKADPKANGFGDPAGDKRAASEARRAYRE